MTTTPRPTRAYRSALREQQAEQTRRLVADAARHAFLENGWAGTSMRAVAQAAGVSQATVFNVFGSKAGLAMALIDSVAGSADLDRLLRELGERAGDPAGQVRAMVGFDRRLCEHSGAVITTVIEGGRQDPELAAAYAEGRRRAMAGRRLAFETWPASAWRDGVDPDHAVEVWALVCNVAAYDTAVTELGWSAQQVEDWWHTTLCQQLLAEGGEGG